MLKPLLLLVLLTLGGLLTAETAQAAPGDTTRVTIFNRRALTRHGGYDTTTIMPAAGKRYRKVLLHYILGRYACPPGTQYCGSWDYTTRLTLKPVGHDTLELARIMTPYATDWLSRNKTHDYVVDVTDYAPLLNGSRDFQFFYDGYSWGFTVTLRLDFIEGTPPQDPIDVQNVYRGTFAYGRTADPIERHLPARTFTAPATGTVTLKNLISGHGNDGAGCAEFCRRYYTYSVNGQRQGGFTYLWRDDCGRNEVYPQTGTWVYNRGNWCPGNIVKPLLHPLSPVLTPGQSYSLDIDMQPYTAANQNTDAQYIWSSQLVTAGPINFTTDASVDEIIAPNANENYYRENPACGGPQLRLRNLGSARLRTATIAYRVAGRGALRTYSWTGNLAYGRDTLVSLPPMPELLNSAGGRFRAWVTTPNGSRDQNADNDTLSTRFNATTELPSRVVVAMLTNRANTPNFVNETSWVLYDAAGNVVRQRLNANSSTLYQDTLNLAPGCYALRLSDQGCNGFSWWAAPGDGTGTMRLLDPGRGNVLRTIDGDFGCEYTLNFRVAGTVTGTQGPKAVAALDVYPNPSQDGRFTFDLNLPARQDISLHVVDALGRAVWEQQLPRVQATVQPLNLSQLAPGVYSLQVKLADGSRLHRKLVID